MPRFFVKPDQIVGDGNKIVIEGSDVNHISRVLRMKRGEELTVSDGSGMDYYCAIESIEPDTVLLKVLTSWDSFSELPVKISLFQGLPKADKMELIIQKTIELGVYEIIPVAMSRCVVKLDDKKSGKKTARWQSIAESAAKQAGRGIIPEVKEPMSYGNALKYAADMDAILFAYENAKGIAYTRELIGELKQLAAERGKSAEQLATERGKSAEQSGDCEAGSNSAASNFANSEAASFNNITNCEPLRIGVFVGPEGGFAEDEVDKAVALGAKVITLGKRILRTETAGMAALSILMYELESE